jgi:hypothetical protein
VCDEALTDTHFQLCNQLSHTPRHDAIKYAIAGMLRAAHITYTIEPVIDPAKNMMRADILATTDKSKVFYDVTVVHPAGKNHIKQAATVPFHTASVAVNYKTKQYEATCKAVGGAFVPLVFEAYGAFEPQVKALISQCSRREQHVAPPEATWLASYNFGTYFTQVIAVALHKGNARRYLDKIGVLRTAYCAALGLPAVADRIGMGSR